ncbi:ABC transporter permease [Micromonospora endolithica]|uniref:Transport permease protein n=1 Tax=Micromonospora endolithica TaxID=230091 RepID=A0A3A9Z7H7_9ACTN|nr:ABC transporter permease [Micromonospora endolithica]RKN44253.1 ABC transporter permease [Micromonospora endolithica]TWJ25721.1 ABC-2 type transport system permease protein [Micromonospora endolithica]
MSGPSVEVVAGGVAARRAFLAILWRDIFVTGKELGYFLSQVTIQPLFMLLVFGKVLNAGGYVSDEYSRLFLPGVIALTAFVTALQTVALPLVMELSYTKEIEDRLLAPLPTYLVAVEKMVIAVLRSLVAAGLMFPVGALVLGSLPWHVERLPLLLVSLVLAGWIGAALGLALATTVPPAKVNMVFAMILTPIMFTGATQYPWQSLDSIAWFKVLTAINPLTYASEAVRGAMVPHVPHIPPWLCLLVLVGAGTALSAVGVRGFLRRTIH